MTTAILAALALVAIAAPTASAGNGGVEEYVETFPGAGGDEPSGTAGGAPDDGSQASASAATATDSQDPDAAAAADLAEKTGPDQAEDPEGQAGSPAPATPAVVETPTTDDSGSDVVLPLILGAGLVAALAFLFLRRRQQLGSG